jgi:hypothetical protein
VALLVRGHPLAHSGESMTERLPRADHLLSLWQFVFLLVSVGVDVILFAAGAPIEASIETPIAILLGLVQLVGR